MDGRTGPPAEGSSGTTGRGVVPPLVGRRDVLEAFELSLDRTADGRFQFLGLVGEPGSGKTRMLAELAELAGTARDRPVVSLRGRASEFEQELPFAVVIDALDDHLETHGEALAARLGEQATRLLATVFPSLNAFAAEPPYGFESGTDRTGLGRYRLYRLIRQLIGELAGEQGLALILDDLHWADDSSVELLEHLVRHPPRGPVLVATAYRPAQASPRLAGIASAASAHGRRLTIDPLSEEETAQFLGPDVSPERCRALHEASGGNPFYLEALARMGPTHLPGRGPAGPAAGAHGGSPGGSPGGPHARAQGGTGGGARDAVRDGARDGMSGGARDGTRDAARDGARNGTGGGLQDGGRVRHDRWTRAIREEHRTDLTELPQPVRTALQMELSGLPPLALQVAQGAAAAADEFEPALAAVAADVAPGDALTALDELVARDVVRPAGAGRFRFRHPLVRSAAYGSAAAGWRLGAHARVADRLAELGAPATERARHIERSAHPGDQTAVATLVEASAAVAAQAPATAAHWLKAALRLVPGDTAAGTGTGAGSGAHPAGAGPAEEGAIGRIGTTGAAAAGRDGTAFPYDRSELLIELARIQSVSGQLAEGRETAREALRLLPLDDLPRRAQAARLCALMERQLDSPHEGRALLLAELRRMTDPQSTPAVMMRMRLVAESMMRGDHRAAQAVLDLMPDTAPGWSPSLELAVAALRPMPAYISGRVRDAIGYIDEADRRMAAAPDEHVADWMDAIAWLCWTETMIGRHGSALERFERSLAIARSTGQGYIVSTLLAGLARTYGMFGRLADAAQVAEEAAEVSRLLGSGHQLIFALPQQSLVAALSGDDASALRYSDEALATGAGRGEWTGSVARYARGLALIHAGRLDAGAEALLDACDHFQKPLLDQWTLLSCCEVMAQVEAARGRRDEAAVWARRAERISIPSVPGNVGLTRLAHAHACCGTEPAKAAQHAREAAEHLEAAQLPIDAGRARLQAGVAYAEAGLRDDALRELRTAAGLFEACGARALHRQVVREQRRQGVRVPAQSGRGTGPFGLSRREMEVASLVAEGHTNQQVAEKLYLSVRTVETHLSHIFGKLGVSSRVAIVKALQQGPGPAPSAPTPGDPP